MATVLFAWELGGGLNHMQQLLRMARPLAAQGHQPVFAVPNVVDVAPLLREDDFPVLQCPVYPARAWKRIEPFVASSFADVLAKHGYADADELSALVAAWQHLVDRVGPALVVADYAPTLCLTLFRSLPIVQTGSWFGAPPVEGPTFPVLVPGQEPLATQEHLLATMREVQRRRGRPAPARVTEFLATEQRFVTTLPELDAYRSLRAAPTWDPHDPLPAPEPGPGDASFFAYLNADCAQVEEVLTGLALLGCRGAAYLRGAAADLKQRLRLQGLTILDQPGDIVESLRRVSVFLHHGGAGSAHTALALGRPQILLPQHLEQSINAQRLRQLGVGAVLADPPTANGAARAMQQMLADPRYAARAMDIARQLSERPRRDPLPEMLRACLATLGEG